MSPPSSPRTTLPTPRRPSTSRSRYCLEDQQLMSDMMGVFRVNPFSTSPLSPVSVVGVDNSPPPIQLELEFQVDDPAKKEPLSPVLLHLVPTRTPEQPKQNPLYSPYIPPTDSLPPSILLPVPFPVPSTSTPTALLSPIALHSPPTLHASPPISPVAPSTSRSHQCHICGKEFPRPSALATHMHTHSGAKPYKCALPGCTKTFAVRSNAKRHTRNHHAGLQHRPYPARPRPAEPEPEPALEYTNNSFAPPTMPVLTHWVPASLQRMSNAHTLSSTRPFTCGPRTKETIQSLTMPFPPVIPGPGPGPEPDAEPSTTRSERIGSLFELEERNSYAPAGEWPYHPLEWRGGLPGPRAVEPHVWYQPRAVFGMRGLAAA